MTRDEFINEVTTFDDLVCFCNTNGLEHIVEYIRDGEDYENYLDELFRDMIYDYGWREARDQMNNVDNDGYDWYETSYGDWVSINEDDNLDEYKDQVIEAMDRDEAWDEPEEPDHLTADDVTAYTRIGIKPDVPLQMDDADLAAGRDTYIEAARQLLQP